jgi:hypothetical protein
MRKPAGGVIKVFKEWYKKHGYQEMKSKGGAIVIAKHEKAFGMENYLRVISEKDYLELLQSLEGDFE